MADVGIVESSRIGVGYRSEKECVILSVVFDDPKNVQDIEFLFSGGCTSIPVKGDTVIVHTIIEEYRVATATNNGVVITSLTDGEQAIYAVKNGLVAGIIEYLSNGELRFNNGEGFAVEFEELKKGFDKFVKNYNDHIHLETGGSTNKPTTPTLATIDDSKVEKVRL